MKMFTDSAAAPTDEERAAALVRDLSWWEVVALTLLADPANEATVPEILQHPLLQARLKFSSNKHPSQVIWGVLQAHTKQDCPNVNYTARTDPLIFSKDPASTWSIDAALADTQVPHLRKILDTFLNPKEPPAVCRYQFTTFHQSFSYEDFVEGIKPQTGEDQGRDDGHVSYEVRFGVFREICRQAEANPSENYAVFIDEINRGNVSSIFGELITLIEEDKRLGKPNELKTKLPYSREEFGVPANLYIIGTMNTADRSVEALDTALRRRFTFEEMRPDADLITQPAGLQVNLRQLFVTINARIEQLLDHDHCIGHYYFMGIHELADLQSVFANKILPLLREFFYGNSAKIGMVLGEPFVLHKTVKTAYAPGSWGADELDEKEVFHFADVTTLTEKDFQAIYAENHPGV
jgi:5-methylcytosine-specific restriction endonuclease McrBC GTP-binding regulatory subunit McrB